jgi:predicted outer membrane protein
MFKTYALASALVVAVSAPAMAQGMMDYRVQAMQANAFEIQAGQMALAKSRNPQVRAYAKEAIRDHRAANSALMGGAPNGPMAGPGGLIGAPLAVAGSAVGAATGAAAGVVGGTLQGGPVGGLEGLGSGAARGAAAGGRLGGMDVDATAGTVMQPSPEQQAMLAELSATPAGPRFDRLYVSQQLRSHQMAIGMTQAYASSGPNPALRAYAQQALPVYQHHYQEAQRLPGARSM